MHILFHLAIIYLKCRITRVYCVNIYICIYRRQILTYKDGPCNKRVNMHASATAAAATAATRSFQRNVSVPSQCD